MEKKMTRWLLLSVLLATAFMVAACGGAGGSQGSSGGPNPALENTTGSIQFVNDVNYDADSVTRVAIRSVGSVTWEYFKRTGENFGSTPLLYRDTATMSNVPAGNYDLMYSYSRTGFQDMVKKYGDVIVVGSSKMAVASLGKYNAVISYTDYPATSGGGGGGGGTGSNATANNLLSKAGPWSCNPLKPPVVPTGPCLRDTYVSGAVGDAWAGVCHEQVGNIAAARDNYTQMSQKLSDALSLCGSPNQTVAGGPQGCGTDLIYGCP